MTYWLSAQRLIQFLSCILLKIEYKQNVLIFFILFHGLKWNWKLSNLKSHKLQEIDNSSKPKIKYLSIDSYYIIHVSIIKLLTQIYHSLNYLFFFLKLLIKPYV